MSVRLSVLITCSAIWLYAGAAATSSLHAQTASVSAADRQAPPRPPRFGIGRPATPDEIAAIDIDVRPDGQGLPDGRGTPPEGERIYAARCAACHGKTGKEGPSDVLVAPQPRTGFPFGRDPQLPKAIGNYWPYATTLYDYIRRAMPPASPGSLSADETYAVVAHLLFLNDLIPADAVIDQASLPKVAMPAKDRFVVDRRGGPRRVR